MMVRRTCVAAALAFTAIAVSSCSLIDVNALPAPGDSYRDGYSVVMQFDNALNLPSRAKVTLAGMDVGVVTGVALGVRWVDVTARIDPAITLPSDIHATLQQATVLGDIYVALERPPSNVETPTALVPGGTIPLTQTTSPPQLEDTIASLAEFVGSGTIQRVQNTIIGLNRVTPPRTNLRNLTAQFAADIGDLSTNIDTVDQLLHGASQTAQVLHGWIPRLQYWFSEQGMHGWERGIKISGYIGNILPSIGSVYSGGFWLVPFLNSAANAAGAVQQSKWDFEAEVPKWRKLFTDLYLPQEKYPALNITSIQGPDGRELSSNVQDVLRMLGATP